MKKHGTTSLSLNTRRSEARDSADQHPHMRVKVGQILMALQQVNVCIILMLISLKCQSFAFEIKRM